MVCIAPGPTRQRIANHFFNYQKDSMGALHPAIDDVLLYHNFERKGKPANEQNNYILQRRGESSGVNDS